MNKSVVMVSRLWNNPQISVRVTDEGIGLSVPLSSFVEALSKEVGNPTLLFSNASLSTKLKAASQKVVEDMKAESSRVV